MYTDDEVVALPDISPDHPRHNYWNDRKRSAQRLVRYLALKKKAASILEVGCGNGWLSFHLATVPGSRVIGIDPDYLALHQAAGVFLHQPNLKFIYGDFCSGILQGISFDIIVFAASLHHLPSVPRALDAALAHLSNTGEIHILDTPMHYRHELAGYSYRLRHDPRSLLNRLTGKSKGFPWIVISPKTQ